MLVNKTLPSVSTLFYASIASTIFYEKFWTRIWIEFDVQSTGRMPPPTHFLSLSATSSRNVSRPSNFRKLIDVHVQPITKMINYVIRRDRILQTVPTRSIVKRVRGARYIFPRPPTLHVSCFRFACAASFGRSDYQLAVINARLVDSHWIDRDITSVLTSCQPLSNLGTLFANSAIH